MKLCPLKWHGGKYYLAPWIIGLMPPRDTWCHYVEPYAGGLNVLLQNDPEGISEVVNDISRDLSNFWGVLQREDLFAEFQRIIEAMPFSEVEYDYAEYSNNIDSVGRAVEFFIRCRQSLAGRMKLFCPVTRMRTRRGMNPEVSGWLSAIEGLPAVHARLKRVLILNRDALEVIRTQDGPKTLFYLDPPYLHGTRTASNIYEHEMTLDQHEELLGVLANIEGKFMLSGYPSELYNDFGIMQEWCRHQKESANHAAHGGKKRVMTECVWTNY